MISMCKFNTKNVKFDVYSDQTISCPLKDEIICNESNSNLLYPVKEKFSQFYECWKQHEAIHWNINENDLLLDKIQFAKCDNKLKDVVMRSCTVLMNGDSTVLDTLNLDLINSITAMPIRAMFCSQAGREFIHQQQYSKMLDLYNGDFYRNNSMQTELLAPYKDILDELKVNISKDDLNNVIFFIMMCEYIMFVPAFLTINYVGYKGFAPRMSEINQLVMRDENLHYTHAGFVLSTLKSKMSKDLCVKFINIFEQAVLKNVDLLFVNGYSDEEFNVDIVKNHVKFIVNLFKRDCKLEYDKTLKSKAEHYAQLNLYEIKINLMEARSTVYNNEKILSISDLEFEL